MVSEGLLVALSPLKFETFLFCPATGVYHYPGTRWYGNTKQGEFMSEEEAREHGYRAAKNGQMEG